MSDLGAIFHVKKDGVQYDAHAYTTLNECPEPNLKIKFKGKQAYVKLTANGSGNVPCYVKPRGGGAYQVIKETAPHGSFTLHEQEAREFYIPNKIHVLKVTGGNKTEYVGVKPNTRHVPYFCGYNGVERYGVRCDVHSDIYEATYIAWWIKGLYNNVTTVTVSWSEEINTHAPTVTDDY